MLDLSQNVITALPSDIGQLLNLKHLILWHCDRLFSIPKLPSKLKQILAYGCKSLKKLPTMSNLEELEILDLGNCSDLTEIQGLKELSSLLALFMQNCNSFFLESTLTKRLFQVCFISNFDYCKLLHLTLFPTRVIVVLKHIAK